MYTEISFFLQNLFPKRKRCTSLGILTELINYAKTAKAEVTKPSRSTFVNY